MLEYFISGIAAGMLFGFVPGIHPNAIASIAYLQDMPALDKSIFIVAAFGAHIVFSLIPSVFFNIPEPRTALATLPGSRMAADGKGIAALKTAVFAMLVAGILSALFFPLAKTAYPALISLAAPYAAWAIGLASAFMLFKSKNRAVSTLLFLASGAIGMAALGNMDSNMLFPLFSGLFAAGALLNYKKGSAPAQKDLPADSGAKKGAVVGTFLGFLSNVFPAISTPAQMALFASTVSKPSQGEYLACVCAINASQFVFSFASYVSAGKARNGVAETVAQSVLIGPHEGELVLAFLAALAIASALLYLARKNAAAAAALDFSKYGIAIVAYLAIASFALCGAWGIIVFAISSGIGYVASKTGIERTALMGSLMVPTLAMLST
jgi:putative membrane protein